MKSTSSILTILRWAVVWMLWPLLIAFILEAAKPTYHSDPASWMYDMKAYMAGLVQSLVEMIPTQLRVNMVRSLSIRPLPFYSFCRLANSIGIS